MGALCGCGPEGKDVSTFWRGFELRKITFDSFCKIYEKNQMNWLNSGETNRTVDLRKCQDLNKLLFNPELNERDKDIFFDKLNEFVNSQSDKLTFFTCLSFFTKINDDETPKIKTNEKQSYIDSIRANERKKNFDLVFESLLKMAIKRSEHEDVTKLFIQLVTEFTVPFLLSDKKIKENILAVYIKENREKLFSQIKMYNLQKFYDYMFNKDNIFMIHNDLTKIQMNRPMDELVKVRTTTNVDVNNNTNNKPTPGETAVKAN
jgi:hypothetical protein